MAWIALQGLSVSVGGQELVRDVTFNVSAGDRIGIVGPNGMGKSTLLAVISGSWDPDQGTRKVSGSLRMTQLSQWRKPQCASIWECARSANSQIEELSQTLSQLEEKMSNPTLDANELESVMAEWGSVSERFSDMGGYEWDARVKTALTAMGFPEPRWDHTPHELSGGEQHRLQLIQVLLSGADIWLLDEPNNHLDIVTLDWLEEQIRSFRGAVIVVSHDRAFLDNISTRIITWEDGFFWSSPGGWTKYHHLRQERLKSELSRNQRIMEERDRLQDYIARFRAGTRASQAQSRLKRLAKLDPVTSVKPLEKNVPRLMHNSIAKAGSRPLASLRDLTVTRAHRFWQPLSFQLPQGAKVALVGPNGTGKSTLLSAIYQAPSEITWYDETHIGYLRQNSVSDLPEELTGIGYLNQLGFDREEIYFLGNHFGLRPDLLDSLLDGWSGGERMRLKLLETLMMPSHLIMLDEPTNHLDISMRMALEHLLLDYPGTLIIASHDRAFLESVSTHTLWSTGEQFIWDKEKYRVGRTVPNNS